MASERERARERLEAAGVHPTTIELLTADESMAASVNDMDKNLLASIAAANPAAATSQYAQATGDFGFTSPVGAPPPGMGQGVFSYVPDSKGFQVNKDTGAIRFNNGVIVDPTSEQVFYPPDEETVAGSPAWVLAIQKKWKAPTIDKWRERLHRMGYLQTKEGGFDYALRTALSEYHRIRYLNGGKAMPFSSTVATPQPAEVYDDALIDQDIREAFKSITQGDEPMEEELRPFRRAFRKAMSRALENGRTPQASIVRGQEAASQALADDPTLSFIADENEDYGEAAESFSNMFAAIEALS